MLAERLAEFFQLSGLRRHVTRQPRRHERGDLTDTVDRAGEELPELETEFDRLEGLAGVEEVVVRCVVPPPAEGVECVPRAAWQQPGPLEPDEPVDLADPFHPHPCPLDQLLGEHLSELAGRHIRDVGVGEDRLFGLGTVDREQGLHRVEPPEVGRFPGRRLQLLRNLLTTLFLPAHMLPLPALGRIRPSPVTRPLSLCLTERSALVNEPITTRSTVTCAELDRHLCLSTRHALPQPGTASRGWPQVPTGGPTRPSGTVSSTKAPSDLR